MSRPTTAYKILTADQVTALETGSFAGAPVDLADGYIHMSTPGQLTETANKHFAGQDNLWVAAVDLEALGDAIKWEVSRGGAEFPHIYAALPLSAVIAYSPLERDDAGIVKLPVTG